MNDEDAINTLISPAENPRFILDRRTLALRAALEYAMNFTEGVVSTTEVSRIAGAFDRFLDRGI